MRIDMISDWEKPLLTNDYHKYKIKNFLSQTHLHQENL